MCVCVCVCVNDALNLCLEKRRRYPLFLGFWGSSYKCLFSGSITIWHLSLTRLLLPGTVPSFRESEWAPACLLTQVLSLSFSRRAPRTSRTDSLVTGWHSAPPPPCPPVSASSVLALPALVSPPLTLLSPSLKTWWNCSVLSVQKIFLDLFLDWHCTGLCSLWGWSRYVWAALLSVSLSFLCCASGSTLLSLCCSLLFIMGLLSNYSLYLLCCVSVTSLDSSSSDSHMQLTLHYPWLRGCPSAASYWRGCVTATSCAPVQLFCLWEFMKTQAVSGKEKSLEIKAASSSNTYRDGKQNVIVHHISFRFPAAVVQHAACHVSLLCLFSSSFEIQKMSA